MVARDDAGTRAVSQAWPHEYQRGHAAVCRSDMAGNGAGGVISARGIEF